MKVSNGKASGWFCNGVVEEDYDQPSSVKYNWKVAAGRRPV